MGDMRRWAALLFVLVLALPLMVSAVEVQRISLTNCGFTDAAGSSVACNSDATVYCYANITIGGSAQGGVYEQVNSISFEVGGTRYSGAVTSGNVFAGVWSASVPIEDGSDATLSLDSVTAISSGGTVCYSESGGPGSIFEESLCYTAYSVNSSIQANCACTYATTSDVCSNDNVRTVTRVPSSGCGSTTPIVQTSTCDFCDPEWYVTAVTCDVNRYDAITEFGTPLRGNGQVTLSSANPSCCSTTGLNSDCIAPVATSTAICALDSWSGGTNQPSGGSHAEIRQQYMSNLTLLDEIAVVPESYNGRQFQPIVFDFDNDGRMETIVLGSGGVFSVLSADANDIILEAQVDTGYDGFVGEGALLDFVRQEDVPVSGSIVAASLASWNATSAWINGSRAGFAAIVQSGGVNRFVSYRQNSSGDYVNLADVSIATTGGNAMSLMCELTTCWFVRSGNTIVQVDAETGATSTISLPGASSVDSMDWRGGVVKFDDMLFAKGWTGSVVNVYACNIGSGSCASIPTYVDFIGNVSALTVKKIGGSYQVAWNQLYTGLVNDTYAQVYVASTNGGVSPVWLSGDPQNLASSGSVPTCLSEPATARCTGGYPGIAFSVGWVTTTVLQTLSGVSSVDSDLLYASEATELLGLTDASYGNPGDLGATTCFNGVCLAVETRGPHVETSNTTIPADPQDFYINSGSGWVGTAVHPGFGGPYQVNSTCWSRDAVVAIGALSENEFVVVLGSVSEGPLACGGTTFYASFSNLTVWKYTVGTDSWSQLGSSKISRKMQVGDQFNSDFVFIHNMKCGSDFGCYLFNFNTGYYVGTQPYANNEVPWVLEISPAGSVSTFSPGGASIGGVAIASNRTIINDYLRDGSDRYVSLTLGWQGTNVVDRQVALLRYNAGSSTSYTLMEYSSIADQWYYGLGKDESDVKWVKSANYQYQAGPNALCKFNTTRYSSNYAPIFKSAAQTWPNFYTSTVDATARNIYVCDALIRKDTNGNSGAPVTTVTHEYEVMGGATSNNLESLALTYPWAVPGVDNDGRYYVVANLPVCVMLFNGSTNSRCSSGEGDVVFTWTVISEGEIFLPSGEEYDGSVTFPQSYRSDGTVCSTPSNRCHPDSITHGTSITSDIPSFGVRSFGETTVPAIAYGFDYGNRVKSIKGFFSGTMYYNFLGSSGGGSSSQDYTETSCYSYDTVSQTAVKRSTTTTSGASCPVRVVPFDYDLNNVDEYAKYNGVFKQGSNDRVFSYGGGDPAGGVVVVDLTGDGYQDVVLLTDSTVRMLTSRADIAFTASDVLELGGVECTADGALVTVYPVSAGGPNPGALRYSAELVEDSTDLIVSNKVGYDSTIDLVARNPGSHSVNYAITDLVTGNSTFASCSLELSFQRELPELPSFTGVCSIAPDGEFNGEGIVGGSWSYQVNSGGTKNTVSMSGGYASFSNKDVRMLHPLSCSDEEIRVSVRLDTDASSDIKVNVIGADSSGSNVYVGGFRVYNGDLYANTGFGYVLAYSGFSTGSYRVVDMDFDRSGSYTIDVDGEGTTSGPYTEMNALSGDLSTVEVWSKWAASVDYVRIEGRTGSVADTRTDEEKVMDEQLGALAACGDGSGAPRDFSTNPAGNFSYDIVKEYCAVFGSGKRVVGSSTVTYCTFDDLQDIISVNRFCYGEAFGYCVEQTWPISGRFDSSGREIYKAGLDGASVCTAALSTSVSFNSFMIPFFQMVWGIITGRAIVSVMVLILVFGLILYLITRRK